MYCISSVRARVFRGFSQKNGKSRLAPAVTVDPLHGLGQSTAALGALGGGYIAVRIAKCRGMFYGVLTGMALFFGVVIAGLCTSTESITLATVIKAAAMLLSGAVGGVVAVNRKQRVR